jgi:hypothetical protein
MIYYLFFYFFTERLLASSGTPGTPEFVELILGKVDRTYTVY